MAREHVAAPDTAHAEPATEPVVQRGPGGPGVQALQALLAQGRPDPDKIVKVIDAYRGEREAILALLQRTLGNAFVQQVVQAMHGLRADVKRVEIAAGDPGDPNADSFLATKNGVKWRAADGDFTGEVTKDKATSHYQIDENDALHADVSIKDSKGSLAWQHDGRTAAELYGDWKDKDRSELGVRRSWELGEGATVTGGVRHQTAKHPGARESVASDQLFATYKQGTTTIDGGLGVSGGGLAGSASVSTALGKHDQVDAAVRHDAAGTSLSAKHAHTFGGGATLTTDGYVRHDDVTTGRVASTYNDKGTSIDGSVTRAADATTYHLGGSQKLDDRWTLRGNADHVDRGRDADVTTGALAATYKDANTSFDANVSRAASSTSLHLGAREQLSERLALGGSVDHVQQDTGAHQTTGKLDLTYRTPGLAGGFGIEGGSGTRDYVGLVGSGTGRIAPNLYATGFGSASYEQGKQAAGHVGAGLTFTPHEKAALTLAGVLDQDGRLETRLQLDVFKSRVESAAALSDAQKNALVSLFVSYSPHGSVAGNAMNDRFGAPTTSRNIDTGGQVMAGIRIKF